MEKIKVAVLVSGGVDSSVALQLLKNQGYDVTAFYLKIWLEDELSYLGDCPWQEDSSFVQAVCEQLKVPLEIVSLQKEYQEKIVAYTVTEVKAGRTPNPDILCNQYIKFGLFLEKIGNRFDKVASGHYAQVREKNGFIELYESSDPIKDQTYFLSHLNQEQLQKIMFPIGHLTKHELRSLAQQFNLPNKDRKDSQGICFLGKFKFSDFIKHHLGTQQGSLIEYETGIVMGIHEGFWFYTIGQRQGIRLAGGPWYVVAKDSFTNSVYISRNYFDSEKKRNAFIVENLHWINNQKPSQQELLVKLRHGSQKYPCILNHNEDTALVKIPEQDQGIAPGQFAVFYDNEICLGSGIIRQSLIENNICEKN
jgi:tRNA-5-taurinomethyluridine 2-sulfurtransferase